jgi:uncharacterized protein YjdB
MKKSILLTLTAMAVLGLASCNSTGTSSKAASSTASTTTSSVATSSSTATSSTAASSSNSDILVEGLTVGPASVDLQVDDDAAKTKQIVAYVSPKNATNQGVSYLSADPTIATVSETGLITAVAYGTTTISVTTSGKNLEGSAITKTIDVTVDSTFDLKHIDSEGDHASKAVVEGFSGNNMLIVDRTGAVGVVYNKSKKWSAFTYDDGTSIAIGDYIKVSQTFTKADNYAYGAYNYSTGTTVAKLAAAGAPTISSEVSAIDAETLATWTTAHKTAETARGWTDGTSAVVDGAHTDCPLVSINVKLYTSGTYLNYSVNDFSGSLSAYVSDAVTDLKADNAEKTYTLTGYLTGVTAGKYTYLFVTKAEAYTRAATDIDAGIKSLASDAPEEGVAIGATCNITAAMNDCPNLADKTITYTSSDPAIATVKVGSLTTKAVVTGVAIGTATITAKALHGDAVTIEVKIIAKAYEVPCAADFSSWTSTAANNVVPAGWEVGEASGNTYATNAYTQGYAGGLKLQYATTYVMSPKVKAVTGVVVTISVKAINAGSTAATYTADQVLFTITPYKADAVTTNADATKVGQVTGTAAGDAKTITQSQVQAAGDVAVTLTGTDIQYVYVSYTNVNVTSAGKKANLNVSKIALTAVA